jgi:hypothetical protein
LGYDLGSLLLIFEICQIHSDDLKFTNFDIYLDRLWQLLKSDSLMFCLISCNLMVIFKYKKNRYAFCTN